MSFALQPIHGIALRHRRGCSPRALASGSATAIPENAQGPEAIKRLGQTPTPLLRPRDPAFACCHSQRQSHGAGVGFHSLELHPIKPSEERTIFTPSVVATWSRQSSTRAVSHQWTNHFCKAVVSLCTGSRRSAG
eukprot:4295491-Amphidinium_carterae.1